MSAPVNEFKLRLADTGSGPAWGIFTSLAESVAAEICAGAGFDFVIVDTEHAATDHRTVLHQLQAMSAHPTEAVVRVRDHDRAEIKRVLDLGARTLLVPMVESAAEAEEIVASTRYLGSGRRGVASGRAAQWGRIPDYHATADEQICVLVQIESTAALDRVEEICAVDGVDGAFVGPMDLANSLGYPGGGSVPEVVDTVASTLGRIRATGTAAGVLAMTRDLVDRYVAAGANFVAAGVDTALLASATTALRRSLD